MSKVLFDYIVEKKHHALRVDNTCDLASEYKARGLSPEERMADRFEKLMKLQTPHILPEEKITSFCPRARIYLQHQCKF